jgi:hypothetical protein
VKALAKKGVKRLAMVAPGFSADCLETLEELDGENREIFEHNGGEKFSLHPGAQRIRTRHGRDRGGGAARADGLGLSRRALPRLAACHCSAAFIAPCRPDRHRRFVEQEGVSHVYLKAAAFLPLPCSFSSSSR